MSANQANTRKSLLSEDVIPTDFAKTSLGARVVEKGLFSSFDALLCQVLCVTISFCDDIVWFEFYGGVCGT